MDKWEMYMKIKQLKEQGFKIRRIARKLGISRTTVYKYLEKSPEEMALWEASTKTRTKKLDAYEMIIHTWLSENPDVSSAQIHDWLMEHYPKLIVGESTVRSYVKELREKYAIPKETHQRVYQAIPDPPMGQQAQVDFGKTNQKTPQGKCVKLYFISFVLSHSRYKYVEWLDRPFTTKDMIRMHEHAFQYFGGMTDELVYDQDALLMDEALCECIKRGIYSASEYSDVLAFIQRQQQQKEEFKRAEEEQQSMTQSLEQLQQQLRTLRLSETANHLPSLIQEAESQDWTYRTFLEHLTSYELERRDEKLIEKRLKWATFPFYKTIDAFQVDEQQSLSRKQINQLKEFTWLDQLFNLIILGPPGVGKTHLATGLGIEAIHQGYKVSFISMGQLIQTLKTEDVTRKSQTRMKRIRDSNLVIIDDLMFMAMDSREANLFFHLINDLYDNASVILTSNKGPNEWGELLGDPGITTAILDRLLHRAEVIHFRNDDSYRMKHRSSIFMKKSVQN